MNVLLLGGGAREHALGWKLAQSPLLDSLTCLPGNPGLAELGPVVEGISPTDAGAVAAFARQQDIDLVVVGPEAPLAAGVIDAFTSQGVPAFGPSRSAARLESSKSFAKTIMEKAGVPTAPAGVFTKREPAIEYLGRRSPPFVVKADGLAAGKGVLVTDDRTEAIGWVDRCLSGDFADAGHTIVIEDFLAGPEVSVFALCDGTEAVPLQPARDYKRLREGDRGPNTGGMGCFSPVDDLPAGLVDWTLDHVIRPVLHQMESEGAPYRGFLYAGLVLTERGPQVLEFNCRLGDPETQVVLPLLDNDLVEVILACLDGRARTLDLTWSDEAAVDVVLAAAGYPANPRRGDPIRGVPAAAELPGVLVFQAGTIREDGTLKTNGGRVINVVGIGPTLAEARRRAYAAAEGIRFAGKQLRPDIAGVTGTRGTS
ncbi:MAG: phosphoribosylamine--glycine ligase [Acidimicrobiia bacterium]|nr:phosphoribosylamine--glycine ligase [Acidimicrobiia bacterium]